MNGDSPRNEADIVGEGDEDRISEIRLRVVRAPTSRQLRASVPRGPYRRLAIGAVAACVAALLGYGVMALAGG